MEKKKRDVSLPKRFNLTGELFLVNLRKIFAKSKPFIVFLRTHLNTYQITIKTK